MPKTKMKPRAKPKPKPIVEALPQKQDSVEMGDAAFADMDTAPYDALIPKRSFSTRYLEERKNPLMRETQKRLLGDRVPVRDKTLEEEQKLRDYMSKAGIVRIDEGAFKRGDPYAVGDGRITPEKERTLKEFAASQTKGNPEYIVEIASQGYSVYEKDYTEFGREKIVELAELPKPKGELETSEMPRRGKTNIKPEK